MQGRRGVAEPVQPYKMATATPARRKMLAFFADIGLIYQRKVGHAPAALGCRDAYA